MAKVNALSYKSLDSSFVSTAVGWPNLKMIRKFFSCTTSTDLIDYSFPEMSDLQSYFVSGDDSNLEDDT